VDNLYLVDGSFMPSIGAVNPTLTIIANALRVGDHIADRIGTTPSLEARLGERSGIPQDHGGSRENRNAGHLIRRTVLLFRQWLRPRQHVLRSPPG